MRNSLKTTKSLSTLLLLLVSSALFAENGYFQKTLENGLRLIIKEDHRSPVVTTQMWCHVGSADEPSGLTGISHMLEHMMFRGTQKYPDNSYATIIKLHGGTNNAFTSSDHTVYFSTIAKQHLPKILQLESDRLHNLEMTEKAFATEKQVVLEERRLRVEDNPDALAHERFTATAHIIGPYHHPVIGWMEDIERYELKDAQDWYDKWYTPSNITLVIVGDVNPEHTYGLVKNYFNSTENKIIKRQTPYMQEPNFGERKIKIQLNGKVPRIWMGYLVPVISTAQSSWEPYALELLVSSLAGGNSSRLESILVKDKKVATFTDANYNPFNRYNTLFEISAIPNSDVSLEDLEIEISEQISDFQDSLMSDEELEKIKIGLIAEKTYANDSLFYSAYEIGILSFINKEQAEFDNYIANIRKVSKEQIQSVAKKYLKNNSKTVTYLEPKLTTASQNIVDFPIDIA